MLAGFITPAVKAAFALALALIGLHLLQAVPEALAYSRDDIAHGQWWRVLSAHFVHFTLHHSVMNAAGLLAVTVALLYRQSLAILGLINVFLPLWISAWLWWQFDGIEQYRGYSGVIYGLIAAGLLWEWSSSKIIYSIALLVLCAKIGYEQLPGYDVNHLMEEIGVPVAIEAHLLGLVGGLAFALIAIAIKRFRPNHGRKCLAGECGNG